MVEEYSGLLLFTKRPYNDMHEEATNPLKAVIAFARKLG
jgi:hypothetical protein